MARKDLKQHFLKYPMPETYGVYQFFDHTGEIIYVGKSVNLCRRMKQYLSPAKKRNSRKRKLIVSQAVRASFEVCSDEKTALLRENQLIQALRPRLNVAGAFSFLYPVIAARFVDRRLSLVRTSLPEEYGGFELFGAFRDRHLTKEMFASLEYLLSFVGHAEPGSRLKDIPTARYSRRCAFRQVPESLWAELREFLSGYDDRLLPGLSQRLLTHRRALENAKQVESSLKILRDFFRFEARKLAEVRSSQGVVGDYVQQERRDALFIAAGG